MRAVSFVNHLHLEFPGNVHKSAMVLGDVDNDSCHELVVGNTMGDIAIFRGNKNSPDVSFSTQIMVCAVAIGDVLNQLQNFLVVVGVEGWCHIYDIKRHSLQDPTPFHIQRLPANTKTVLLADIDGDGSIEMVLGLTDRVVRTYRWVSLAQVFQTENRTGKLVGLHKWEFANQIGSMVVEPSGRVPHLLVAQPGGTYLKLECTALEETPVETQLPMEENWDLRGVASSPVISKLLPEFHPLASSRMRNPQVPTEIIGEVRGTRDGNPASLLALATLDGTLMLVDGDTIIWSLQVDHQLFALAKLDLTGDGLEEVVACAWDGQTYMVNQDRMSVRFQFEEPVCAFTAGHFTLDSGQSSPCLVYATFQDTIHLYYDVRLPLVKTLTFMDVFSNSPRSATLLDKFNLEGDPEEVRKLCHQSLYHHSNLKKS